MPLPTWLLLAAVLLAGAAVAAQAGANATLARALGSPALAALASFATGTLTLALVVLARRETIPTPTALATLPWWAWIGGLLGALFVTTATIAAPRIGAAPLLGLAITGQLLAALLLDHHGWLGYPERAITWTRIAGTGLLLAGAAMIRA